MGITLLTMLGRGKEKTASGYRLATYSFTDGTEHVTPFFGMALAAHLKVRNLIVLGTAGSMWFALVEQVLNDIPEYEILRLELLEAECQGAVTQDLLDRIMPWVSQALGYKVGLHLIPSGISEEDQVETLKVTAEALGKQRNELHIDITHGFRHLAAVGFLSVTLLERLRPELNICGLWYGALEMTRNEKTPVIRLDGLHRVQRWVTALDRYDASGDYGVFAPLLTHDGVPDDKAHLLVEAAYFESITQTQLASNSLCSFLHELDNPLSGASELFRELLKKRLQWASINDLSKQQLHLAKVALKRHDYLRAMIFGLEALISDQTKQAGLNPHDYKDRNNVDKRFLDELKEGKYPLEVKKSYNSLKSLRNAMAHGTPPRGESAGLIKNEKKMKREIKKILEVIERSV
ncbi:TIGR02221 family CRISPR-associated protein [Ferrovum sp.]|uniref:TIGR02221 family CRISPR-associated protein n=1 Tax=Ferrovum sp. TaxID=2609467 RepID=UPI00260C7D7B|nr:TIGR02221 family CRISPR-associated protein [Ferrovum sp.]